MPFKNISKNQTRLLGLTLILAGLLLNEWTLTALFSADGILSPRSVVIIWLANVVLIGIGLVLAISGSVGTLLNALVGVAITGLLLYGLEMFYYRLNHPTAPPEANAAAPPPPTVHHEGDYTHDFTRPNDLLGYVVRPNAQIHSIKKLGDEVIYDVIYTTDAYHRRVTPLEQTDQRQQFMLFFGDSFTFGEGVQDNETLPYYVAQSLPDYRAYNYGLSGYGPQQMLAKLQSDDLITEVPEGEGIVIYVFIDAHVERAIGSMYVYNNWGDQMPYYTTTWQGDLVRQGNFTTGRPLVSSLYWWLGQREMARYYNINLPNELASHHYGQAARIIAEARDTFRAKYNSDEFYVVIYPDEGDYFEDMEIFFDQYNLNILNYDERMKLNPDEGLAIKGDGHPTGQAHQIVADWIVEDLQKKVKKDDG